MVATNEIGVIRKNTYFGVFGDIQENKREDYADTFMPVAMKQDIKQGRAWIYSNLDGAGPKKYEIEIQEIDINSSDNKSMVIKITDKNPKLRLAEFSAAE